MRQLILLFCFFFFGCVNNEPSGNIQALHVVENISETEIVYTPSTPLPNLNYSEDLEEAYPIYEPCLCEYAAWKDNGLICVGIRCTEECSEEVRSCNERRRACVPEFP